MMRRCKPRSKAALAGLALAAGLAASAEAATHTEISSSPIFNGGAGPEAVGPGIDQIRGSISGGDNGDLFKLVFDTGGTLTILARGTSGALNPSLFLFDASGAGLRVDDNSGPLLDARIELTIAAGTYYLGIGDDPLQATDTDGSLWNANAAIDAPPPADFGILDRLDNIGTVVSPGNYRVFLSIATAGTPVSVPEPATLGLLAAGLIGFGVAGCRRRSGGLSETCSRLGRSRRLTM